MTRARLGAVLAVALVSVSGCGQLLGLGDYGEAPESGAKDPTAAAEASIADSTLDQASPDAGLFGDLVDAANGPDAADARGDASTDDAADEQGDADASETQSSDGSMTGAIDVQMLDAPMETTLDVQLADAPADAGFDACPTACNGGCGDGATCTISITSFMTGPLICPPGLGCQVLCMGTQVCTQAITCAAGQPCRVSCRGNEACSSTSIDQGSASSLCVECLASGNPGCNSVTCTGFCGLHCVGGCGGSCGNCARVPSCP